jgi:hypothetical protein
MTSEADQARAEQILLSLATEDWYSLREAESAVDQAMPDVDAGLRQLVIIALRSLADHGLLRFARLNFSTNEEQAITPESLSAILNDEESWNLPSSENPWAICLTATETGEQRYFGAG